MQTAEMVILVCSGWREKRLSLGLFQVQPTCILDLLSNWCSSQINNRNPSHLLWSTLTLTAGNGRRRSISCPSCNGQAEGNKLLAPLALACGAEGSIFVGDFNYIRRIFPSGNVTSVMELRYFCLKSEINPLPSVSPNAAVCLLTSTISALL